MRDLEIYIYISCSCLFVWIWICFHKAPAILTPKPPKYLISEMDFPRSWCLNKAGRKKQFLLIKATGYMCGNEMQKQATEMLKSQSPELYLFRLTLIHWQPETSCRGRLFGVTWLLLSQAIYKEESTFFSYFSLEKGVNFATAEFQ